MSHDDDVFVCVHCGEGSPSDEVSSDDATGWWTCPLCGSCNGDEDD